jgi:hypothetical protein
MASTNPIRWLQLGGVLLAIAFTWSVKPEAAQAQLVIEVGAQPPPRIETYPHDYYDDRDVYWAHGHWYYSRGGRWYYYRHEPPPLYHHRVVSYGRHPHHHHVHEVYREERPEYYHHAHPRHRERHHHDIGVR